MEAIFGSRLYACDLFMGKGVNRKGLNLRVLQMPFTLSGEYDSAIQNSCLRQGGRVSLVSPQSMKVDALLTQRLCYF
jgi:hypothetical protein